MTQVEQMENDKVIHVAGYLRVSTDEQAISGLGLDAQSKQVRGMAMAKGWPEPVMYEDAGISGMIDVKKRPEGARLLADIAAGTIDAVIVTALDRIGRRALYILNFIDTTKDAITLVSCKESVDTSTPVGKFLVTIMAGIAELERDTISQRTKDALEARGRSVGVRSGSVPYGYISKDREITINPRQAEVVRFIFDQRARKVSYQAISDAIQEQFTIHLGASSVFVIAEHKKCYLGGKRGMSDKTWPVIL